MVYAAAAVTMAVDAHAVRGAKKRAAERLGAILRTARTATETDASETASAG